MRGSLTIVLSLLAAGCASTGAVRARLEAGDRRGALEAAGERPAALREVALATLVEALASPESRPAAVRGLAAARGGGREELLSLLADGDGATSCAAAAALLAARDDRARPRLEACLASGEGPDRALALEALSGTVDDEAAGRFLGDGDPSVRVAAVAALASRDAPRATELLGLALEDSEASVRAAALLAIARPAPPERAFEAFQAAAEAVDDPALTVRLAAVEALGRLAESTVGARERLAEVAAASEGPERARAAGHLARLGDEAAVRRLGLLLAEGPARDASTAAIAAGQVGAPMAAGLRAVLGRGDGEVRLHAAVALVAVGDEAAGRAELSMLASEPGWLGLRAAAALAEAEVTGPVRDRLEAALEDPDRAQRAYVAMVAASIDEAGLDLARTALADQDLSVRVAAATSVLRILARQG